MKISSIIAAALAAAGAIFKPLMGLISRPSFRQATPSHRSSYRNTKAGRVIDGCPQPSRSDSLPRGYPGAKLARKAMLKQVAVKHPRGLRLDGATV